MPLSTTISLTPESIALANRLGPEIKKRMRKIVRDVVCMSAKSESLQPKLFTVNGTPLPVTNFKLNPTPRALLHIEQGDIVELHWPGGDHGEGIEPVQVVEVRDRWTVVDRIELIESSAYHYDVQTDVRREWLRPYKNA